MENSELTKENLIAILGHYLTALPPRWQAMQSYIAIYITLVTTILGALIAGANVIKTFPANLYLLPGYILLFLICRYAKITIKKQNKHIKELIVIIAKIEREVGLYNYNPRQDCISIWKDDEFFLTPKWINDRIKSGSTSSSFIDSFQDSSATYVYKLFSSIQICGAIVFLFGLILPLLNHKLYNLQRS